MTAQQEREEFEAWRLRTTKCRNPQDAIALAGFGNDALYFNDTTRAMWSAWQARASLSLPSSGDGWISVDERLPGEQGQDSEEVMCFLNGHCASTDFDKRNGGGWGIRLGYFDAEKQAFRVHGRPDEFVTHWRALPTPPAMSQGSSHHG